MRVTPHDLRRTALAAAALFAFACSSGTGPLRPKQVETRTEGGFTITEQVRVGGGLRRDFERAVALLEQEQFEAAIELLESFTEAAPLVSAGHIDLGMALARVGELERAEASLRRALELNPKHPAALNELGIVLRRSGRFDEARRSYEQALSAWPDFHFARLNLAILCDTYLQDADCALEHYERYIESAPGDESAAMWIADLRNRVGR